MQSEIINTTTVAHHTQPNEQHHADTAREFALSPELFTKELFLAYEGSQIAPHFLEEALRLGGCALAAAAEIRDALHAGLQWRDLVEFFVAESKLNPSSEPRYRMERAQLNGLLTAGLASLSESTDIQAEDARCLAWDLAGEIADKASSTDLDMLAIAVRCAWTCNETEQFHDSDRVANNLEAWITDCARQYVARAAEHVGPIGGARGARGALERITAFVRAQLGQVSHAAE